MRLRVFVLILGAVAVAVLALGLLHHSQGSLPAAPPGWSRIDHVADGDTVVVGGHVTVRLVQIDTPEVFFTAECYGEQASAETKKLLPRGTLVRLEQDPATDSVDAFGRVLRYVIRADGVDVNLQLVADGAATPYFFDGVRGAYAAELLADVNAARAAGRGLWGACPGTELAPEHGVSTGPPN
jgi:micrococcal nuclease